MGRGGDGGEGVSLRKEGRKVRQGMRMKSEECIEQTNNKCRIVVMATCTGCKTNKNQNLNYGNDVRCASLKKKKIDKPSSS